jgi:RNA polymerase sigma-70 factor (ECF subfamily)
MHLARNTTEDSLRDEATRAAEGLALDGAAQSARLRQIFAAHFSFVWRTLRRLGVASALLPDASQRVFWAASRRLEDIRPRSERAFLFSTARRVAADFRRLRHSTVEAALDAELVDRSSPTVEELVDQKRARELLDRLLDKMNIDLREVLILQEGEGMTLSEIAAALDIPQGTAASRLRRAREEFRRHLLHHLAAQSNVKGRR